MFLPFHQLNFWQPFAHKNFVLPSNIFVFPAQYPCICVGGVVIRVFFFMSVKVTFILLLLLLLQIFVVSKYLNVMHWANVFICSTQPLTNKFSCVCALILCTQMPNLNSTHLTGCWSRIKYLGFDGWVDGEWVGVCS